MSTVPEAPAASTDSVIVPALSTVSQCPMPSSVAPYGLLVGSSPSRPAVKVPGWSFKKLTTSWTATVPARALIGALSPVFERTVTAARTHVAGDVEHVRWPVYAPENVRSCVSAAGQEPAPAIWGGPLGD